MVVIEVRSMGRMRLEADSISSSLFLASLMKPSIIMVSFITTPTKPMKPMSVEKVNGKLRSECPKSTPKIDIGITDNENKESKNELKTM